MKQGKVNLKNNFFSARRKQTLLAKKRKKARKLGLTTRAPFPEDLKDLFEHYQKGRIDTAISLGFSITENFPHHPIAWSILGASLLQAGRMEEALNANRKLVELSPEDPDAYNNLAAAQQEVGKFKEAEINYKKAISLKYDYPEAHHNLGNLCSDQGRFTEAQECYEHALTLNPQYTRVYRMYSLIKDFKSKDEHLLKMYDLYLNQHISDDQRVELCFALGKVCEDLKDYARAFKFFSEGNLLRKKLLGYDISKDSVCFQEIKSSFSKILKSSSEFDQSIKSFKPIFIIGMPRSGTTLVEQIIASHSEVAGAGELPFITDFGDSIARGLTECNENEVKNFREKYISKIKKIVGGNFIFTDKMPQNFLYLGLISIAFPDAKIVHVKRDPAATCWSNYKSFFTANDLGYCYDLNDIADYYLLYEGLMEFWGEAFGERIYHLDYEALTKNQNNEIQLLIKYLGLEWEKGCLKPQENKRSIQTASNYQVRKKIYQGSSQKWKKFKPFINNVFDHL